MAQRVIDYNRGVQIQTHRTGVDVYMYIDTPGVYLNAYGTPVSEQLAKEAGYDVERYSRAKLAKDLVAKAKAEIEAQIAGTAGFVQKVIVSAAGFEVVQVNDYGGHIVRSPDGQVLTPFAMPLEGAKALLGGLAPGVEQKGEEKEEPVSIEAPPSKGIRVKSLAD